VGTLDLAVVVADCNKRLAVAVVEAAEPCCTQLPMDTPF
jgi:hypothetical protein